MSIIITGANGYVGKSICEFLYNKGIHFKTVTRGNIRHHFHYGNNVSCDFSEPFDLIKELNGYHYLIHLASCVHNRRNFSADEYRVINIEATRLLVNQASSAKMHRFIFFSSAAVFGQQSVPFVPFTSISDCNPVTEYGKSKYMAEKEIKNICKDSELSYSIIRPPMIYGKDAPGNWSKLLKLLRLRLPVPLGSIRNLRSFLYIGNLLSFIETLIKSQKAKNKVLLVTDDNDISTTALINEIKTNQKYHFINFKLNIFLLNFACKLLRLENELIQLTNDMQLDIACTKSELDWEPPFDVKESIKKSI